jgi:hypothetical protein
VNANRKTQLTTALMLAVGSLIVSGCGSSQQRVAEAAAIASPQPTHSPTKRKAGKMTAPIIADLNGEPSRTGGLPEKYAYVCDSPSSLDKYFNDTNYDDPTPGCAKRKPGKVIVLGSAGVDQDGGPPDLYKRIHIRSMNGAWAGYAMNNYVLTLSDNVLAKIPAEQSPIAAAMPQPTDEPSSDDGSHPILIGYVGEVGKDGDGIACYDSKEALDQSTAAAVAQDKTGFAEIVEAHSVRMSRGDKVRGLETFGFAGLESAKIRLESGTNAGTACYVPQYASGQTFVNLRRDGDS